jgi:GT2 family glycosyltransferase
MEKLVSVLIITRNRSVELSETLLSISTQSYHPKTIIVLENGSDKETVLSNKKLVKEYEGVYVVLHENLGVSGGRNVALSYAKGEYFLEIDDDAVFGDDYCIEKAVQFMDDNPSVGISAFKIINYYTKEITPQEYPFRNKRRDVNSCGSCTWFIGAGHIIRRELITEIGVYREFFPWGSEEQDLSLRAINAGFEIRYFPSVVIYHKKTPNARIQDPVVFAGIALKNRIKVALLNLPLYSTVTYFIVRGVQLTLKYRSLTIVPRAMAHLLSESNYIRKNRMKIGKKAIKYLRKHNGQLYY